MDFVSLVSTVGFPIAAFFWLAFRLEGTVGKNTEALQAVKEALIALKSSGAPTRSEIL